MLTTFESYVVLLSPNSSCFLGFYIFHVFSDICFRNSRIGKHTGHKTAASHHSVVLVLRFLRLGCEGHQISTERLYFFGDSFCRLAAGFGVDINVSVGTAADLSLQIGNLLCSPMWTRLAGGCRWDNFIITLPN